MASLANAFDLLNQAQNISAGAGKKKKKAQKAKEENAGSGQAAVPVASAPGGVVDMVDGVEQIERAALEARTVADKCKLWKEWASRAGEHGPRATKYKDADGSFLDFNSVLLRSRAFESSLESAFSQGLTDTRQEAVAQLLLTFTHISPASAQALATSLVQLSTLTQNEPMDVKAAAQHAVRTIASSLKAADSGSVAEKASRLGQTIGREQTALQKLMVSNTGAAAKEQAEVARRIFRLTGEQFDLLQTDTHTASASGALDQLRSTISSKIKVQEPSSGKGGKGKQGGGGGQADAAKAALLASLRKEDAALAGQADQLAAQVRNLEAQLRSLRQQQQQVEDNRAALQQRMRMAGDSSHHAAKGGANAAQSQQQLAAVEMLSSVVSNASSVDPDVQAALPMVSADFVAAGRQYLATAKSAMAEVPARITFYKQRIAQAEGLLRLGSKDNGKIKEDAERLMADLVHSADDLLASSTEVASEVQGRYDAIMRATPDAATLDVLSSVDGLLADIRASYDTVQQLLAPPPPAATPAPAPAPTRPAKVAASTPAKAAAPTPAKAAAPAPAPTRPAAVPAPVAAAPPPAPVVPTAAPPAPAPAAAPAAVAVVEANPASAPKSAFDAAAAYLAARPVSARPEVAAPAQRKPAAPAPAPRPASAAPNTAPRQWGKPVDAAPVAAPADAGEGEADALPTPAEAFKVAGPPPVAAGGEVDVPKPKKKNNRPKA